MQNAWKLKSTYDGQQSKFLSDWMVLSCFKDEKGLYKGWNVRKRGTSKESFSARAEIDGTWERQVELRAAGTTDPASIRLKDITTSGFSAIVAKPPNTAVGDDSMTES